MVEWILPFALGGSTLASLSLCAALGVGLRRAHQESTRAHDALHRAGQTQAHLQDLVRRQHDELRRGDDARAQAERAYRATLQSQEARLAGVITERDRVTAALDDQTSRLMRATNDLEAARRDASASHHEVRRLQRVLGSLGLEVRDRRHLLDPDERLQTRAMLRRLLLSTGSEGAALVDGRGLGAFGVGRDAALERLGVAAALASDLEPDLCAVSCAPIAGVSLTGPRFAQHLLRLHGTPWWVAVENLGEAPLTALRHARLELTGAPVPPGPVPPLPEHVIDLDDVADESLARLVRDWAGRWSVQAATVLGPDTRPLAATRSAEPGAAMGLRRRLRGVMARAARDRVPQDTLTLTAWTEDGLTMQVLFTHAEIDTPAVVCVSPAPLPEAALDELRATVRWHLSASPFTAREAS